MKLEKVSRVRAHTSYKLADGTQVPGVTTILDVLNKGRALLIWANKIGLEGIEMSKYVDKLADAGTLAHQIIAHDLGGTEPEWDSFTKEQRDLAENAFLKYLYWRDQHTVTPIFVERPLVSEHYGFGGTIDCYAQIDGMLGIWDIKTSKGIWPEHLIQVGAYTKLAEEHGHLVEEARILQVGRTEDEGFRERVMTRSEIEVCWKIFLCCLDIYHLRKQVRV